MSTQQFQGPVEMLEGLELKGNKLRGATLPVVSITDATFTVRAEESGTIFTLNRAAGITVTLPAAVAGLVYEFYIGTTFTGDSGIINTASSADTLTGAIQIFDVDDKGTHTAMNEDVATIGWSQPAAADHQIVINAATTSNTKGAMAGGHLVYKCVSDALWSVSGFLIGDGTLVTPFT